mmetsp:Transcript_20595/g.43233  ORF Transcript_20595/g.43233 Transcript_20595/m.43233 type:complete len:177 (-) Transcript_20595:137-667(-)
MAAYRPCASRTRSSCRPSSATLPSATTMILSANAMLLSLWEMRMVVRPRRAWRSQAMTRASVAESSPLVASSHTSMGAFLIAARAIATRCRCPPDRPVPRSPTRVRMPSGSCAITSPSCAPVAASTASASLHPSLPYMMLYSMSSLKIDTSCCTTPTASRRERCVTSRISCPSMVT